MSGHIDDLVAGGEIGGRTVRILENGEVDCHTYPVAPLAGETGRDPTELTVINGTLLFSSSDAQHGRELVVHIPVRLVFVLRDETVSQRASQMPFGLFRATASDRDVVRFVLVGRLCRSFLEMRLYSTGRRAQLLP